MMKIEYHQLTAPMANVSEADLNALGAQGWQLCSINKLGDEIGTYGKQAGHYLYTFSRSVFAGAPS